MTPWIRNLVLGALRRARRKSRLETFSRRLASLKNHVDMQIRRLEAHAAEPVMRPGQHGAEALPVSIAESPAPWSRIEPGPCPIPGMINREEKQYYLYLGRYYQGRGAVVELGPWLGCSTFYIVEGLKPNPRFAGRPVMVYDDFVWRADWMDEYVPADQRLPDGADFQPLFDRYTGPIREHVRAGKRRIAPLPDNAGIPELQWDGGPVEIMYIDCGRTFEANEAWYRLFSPGFLPGVTLLVMEDWRTHLQVPSPWYNQTRSFTESKGRALQLIHEVSEGCLATFLYRGPAGSE
jgi:hypothetical protein